MRGYPDPPLTDAAAGIVLRPWRPTPGDAAALAAAWADPVIAHANPPPPQAGEATAARWIAGSAERAAAGVSVDLVIAPVPDDGGAVWGEVGLHNPDPTRRRAEIGWWIVAGHRGQGLAAAAAGLLAGWALRPAGDLDQIFARIAPANAASAAVARRAGFTRLGAAAGMDVWARRRA